MKINWTEASTKRGIVWVLTSIIGLGMILMGKDPSPVIVLATGVAGGLGITLPDATNK